MNVSLSGTASLSTSAAMRSGNGRNLLTYNIEFAANWIQVRSRPGAETKCGNDWKVPLHPRLKKILQALPKARDGYFFTAPPSSRYPDGGHWINTKRLNDDFTKILKKLAIPTGRIDGFTVHDPSPLIQVILLESRRAARIRRCLAGTREHQESVGSLCSRDRR